MLVSVMLGSFIGMMTSMKCVTVRSMSVMCTLFWCGRLVMLRGLAVVVSGVRVMLGGFRMMLGAFMFHGVPPEGERNDNAHEFVEVPP